MKKIEVGRLQAKKLENPKFKQAYDEIEEEFFELNKKLSAEHKEKNYSEKKFYVSDKKYFGQTANL